MAKIKRIGVPLEAVNDGHKFAALQSKEPVNVYVNGHRTDEITGTGYNILLQGNGYIPIKIKIDGADKLPELTDEAIRAACSAMKPYLVRFTDCKIDIYDYKGELGMSGTASGIQLVQAQAQPQTNK